MPFNIPGNSIEINENLLCMVFFFHSMECPHCSLESLLQDAKSSSYPEGQALPRFSLDLCTRNVKLDVLIFRAALHGSSPTASGAFCAESKVRACGKHKIPYQREHQGMVLSPFQLQRGGGFAQQFLFQTYLWLRLQ